MGVMLKQRAESSQGTARGGFDRQIRGVRTPKKGCETLMIIHESVKGIQAFTV